MREATVESRSSVAAYEIDPLCDARWDRFLETHPRASVFHSTAWLRALHKTYGYEPVVYTTASPAAEVRNGIVLCRVRSWLTGSRLVSVPFSDHCQPLVDDAKEIEVLFGAISKSVQREKWKYFELRPLAANGTLRAFCKDFTPYETYCFQSLDLRPEINCLFRSFDRSCVQRKIHRAEQERLTYEEGRSEALLGQFYDLLLMTRRRHGLPPQPLSWFQNTIDSLQDKILIRVVSKDKHPIASIITIFYKNSLVYKYGCSDSRFHNLGGMALAFWKAIQDGKQRGAVEFDLGRSERNNPGLITFKENWAAKTEPLTYYRYPRQASSTNGLKWKTLMKWACSRLPDSVLTATGRILYRHIG